MPCLLFFACRVLSNGNQVGKNEAD